MSSTEEMKLNSYSLTKTGKYQATLFIYFYHMFWKAPLGTIIQSLSIAKKMQPSTIVFFGLVTSNKRKIGVNVVALVNKL